MDLKLPPLGEGADSGTVVKLLVKEGDLIARDQPILELENEKAVATIPSTGAGTVAKIYIQPGDKVSVGQPLLSVREPGAAGPPAARVEPAPAAARDRIIQTPSPEQAPEGAEEPAPEEGGEAGPALAPAAAPFIRKMARDLGIDLTRVRGTARGGRIVLEDVRGYIQRLQRLTVQPKPAAAMAVPPAPAPRREPIDFAKWGPVSRQAFSPLRQVIARRLTESWHTIPQVTQFDAADITRLMSWRQQHAGAGEQQGARLTLTALVLRIVVDTLKRHPRLNASLDEAAQEIVLKEYYHLGIAVDTEAGLIVPVIRDVDRKNLVELSKELEDLARRARDRKVSAEELRGGTFTISNQGGIGSGHFTPIVNQPEAAILGLGRSALQAVVRDNAIAPRLLLPLGLSYDHRIIDGAAAARFMVDLVRGFEEFNDGDLKL